MTTFEKTPFPAYSDNPKVCVVLPTFNGTLYLEKVVIKFVHQSYQNFELIIVDDGSKEIDKVYWDKLKSYSKKITVIHQANQGRAASRNNGVLHSSGEIIVFIDDDIFISETFLFDHVQFHLNNANCALVGRIVESCSKEDRDFIHFKRFLSDSWQSDLVSAGLHAMTVQNLFLTAANFSISRFLFLHLEGFDARLRDCEDFDLGIRLLKEKIPVYFNPFIIGVHNDKLTCEAYINRRREYSVALLKLKVLKPDLGIQSVNLRSENHSVRKRLLVRLFGFSVWKVIIDKFNFLKFLPKKLRYKIYEWVVYAGSFTS